MSHENHDDLQIIEKIYDVAVDPARLEELVDVWEARIAPLRLLDDDHDPNQDVIFNHFTRMGLFLDRLEFADPQGMVEQVSDSATLATIIVSSDLKVQQLNKAAKVSFGLEVGDEFNGIFSENRSQKVLEQTVINAINNPNSSPQFLHFKLEKNQKFVVVRVQKLKTTQQKVNLAISKKPTRGLESKFDNISKRPQDLALIVTTLLAWQPRFGHAIKAAFELTTSEVEIVRALIEGYTIDEIAETRQRSKATVRTQVRSIFEKTQTRSQAELIRISLTLMDMAVDDAKTENKTSSDMFDAPSLGPTVFLSLTRPTNRRLDHIILGDPNGKPLLYLGGGYGFIRWPVQAEAMAKENGIKVVVPVRAGYGHSTPLPPKINYAAHVADDFIALLDHYDIATCPVMSQGGDLCFATILAAQYPERVSAIFANAPMMPLWKKQQFEQMDKWYRFIIANARYAPRTLPYLVKAGFYLALSVGQRRFMNSIYSGNPADLETITDPEIFEALVTGAEIILSRSYTAYEVFAREVIIESSPVWGDELEKIQGKLPIHAHIGMTSPMLPAEILAEVKQRYHGVEYHMMPDAGELVFFKHWEKILDFIQPYLGDANS